MKKLIIILLVISQTAIAQQVQWRNNFGFGTSRTAISALGLDNQGNIYGYGSSTHFGRILGNTIYPSFFISKHSPASGDSVYFRNMGYLSSTDEAFTLNRNIGIIVSKNIDNPTGQQRLRLFSPSIGTLFSDTLLPGAMPQETYTNIEIIPNKGYLFYGYWLSRTLQSKACAVMLDNSFRLKWHILIDTVRAINSIEPLQGGQISLNTGNCQLVLDTNGMQVSQQSFQYTRPANTSPKKFFIRRMPDGSNLLVATNEHQSFFNITVLRKYSSDFSRIIWETSDTNLAVKPVVHWDNSILIAGNPYVTKYDSLGNRIWRVLYYSMNSGQTSADVTSAVYSQDGSVYLGGRYYPPTLGYPQAMLIKVSGMGQEYRPAEPRPPLSVEKNQEPNLQVYPNPFTNTLRLSHKDTAQLLDVHGRIILSQAVEAGEELKVDNLPKGMYLLRLQSVGGKLYVRKVVRE